ncbi:MAG TPA: hypothetical protein PLB88_11070 [Thermoanaerobaculaceae bacterium]|nr:hypothetical protein [Thermoanaerobaculaceae bacterium]
MTVAQARAKAKAKSKKLPRSLQKREALLDRVALVARLNELGESRRAQTHARNLINEHEKLHATLAKGSDVQKESAVIGEGLRHNEQEFARDFRDALRTPAGMTPYSRFGTPAMTPGRPGTTTPAWMLPPLGVTPVQLPPRGFSGQPPPRAARVRSPHE